jgi:hypothetical protein
VSEFKTLVQCSKSSTIYTRREFQALFFKGASARHWSQQNAHGEWYKDAWQEPLDSWEYQHAHELTKRRNFEAMWDLPFPKDMLIESMKIYNCVRDVNFLCHWVLEKDKVLQQVEQYRFYCIQTTTQLLPDLVRIVIQWI